MTARLSLALTLWLAATTASAAGELENGSSTILRAAYSMDVEISAGCNTLVIVASDKEILRVTHAIKASSERLTFHLGDEGGLSMRLRPYDQHRLYGHLSATGRRVLVMSQTYAKRNGF